MPHARKLLEEALNLPVPERGRIIHELIRSLEGEGLESAEEVEAAWAPELQRRAEDAQGGALGVDLDKACDELEAKRGNKAR